MAASYISVPRDLTKVKSKVMFNLTKRQLICFGMAVLIGVPSFFLMKTDQYGSHGNDGDHDAVLFPGNV